MDKKYADKEMKRILRQSLSTPPQTEQKIQEAYTYIRRDAAMQSQFAKNTQNGSPRAGRKKTRRWMVPAAAAAVLALSSITVAALSGAFTKTFEQTENGVSYQFEVNYELKPVDVKITAAYIPEGYEQMDSDSLKWCADGSWQNGISLGYLNSASLANQGAELLNEENVKSVEKTTINGQEAHLITRNYDPETVNNIFDKCIYIFNETDGYVGIIWGGNDLSMEELKKVAEGITYTVTDAVLEYPEEEDLAAESEQMDEQYQKELASAKYGVPKEYIYTTGTVFNRYQEIGQAVAAAYGDTLGEEMKADFAAEKGVEISVESAEVIDSAADFPTEGFFDYDAKIAGQLNEDGTIKDYPRITYAVDPDTLELQELSRDEAVGRKFLKVTINAKNMSDETIDFWAGEPRLTYLNPSEEGNYSYADTNTMPLNSQEYGMEGDIGSPIYFDASPYAGELNGHFFFRDLAAGESLTYTLLYVVDEDRLENLYLAFDGVYYEGLAWDGNIFYDRYVKLEV